MKIEPVPQHLLNPAALKRRPRGHQRWGAIIQELTAMSVAEFKEWLPQAVAILEGAPPDLTIRQLMVAKAILAYLKDPNPAMFQTLADREEGKPPQATLSARVDASDWLQIMQQHNIPADEIMLELGQIVKEIEAPKDDSDA